MSVAVAETAGEAAEPDANEPEEGNESDNDKDDKESEAAEEREAEERVYAYGMSFPKYIIIALFRVIKTC